MDGVERRKTLKERLGLNGMGCCGAHWGFGLSTISVLDEEESPFRELINEGVSPLNEPVNQEESSLNEPINSVESSLNEPINRVEGPLREPMNLAMALAVERQYWSAQYSRASPIGSNISRPNSALTEETAPETPSRMSLMRLLNETDGAHSEREATGKAVGFDAVCCVCMERKKGAAFIPCGHTFCRVCSRELWLNRGSCPLCNRLIVEVLDIF